MNLHTTKKQFGSDTLPAYTGNQNTQEAPPIIRANVLNEQRIATLQWDKLVTSMKIGKFGQMMVEIAKNTDNLNDTIKELYPGILAAKASDEDNPSWDSSMNRPQKEGYWDAMKAELKTLTEKVHTWDIVDRESWMNILPSTWALKCKRYLDGLIKILKARLCARGDRQQEGVDYFETYAPVVNWQTVSIMIIISILLDLKTIQVDYTAAFLHADIDKDHNWERMSDAEREKSGVYVEMPRGFAKPVKVLRLQKSLYRLKQAPRNFFLHLKSNLENIGFVQSKFDACRFISDKVFCIVYVGDTLFFSPDQEHSTQLISKLKGNGLEVEIKDDVAGFFGVHIEHKVDGTIHLTQLGLIDIIIIALSLQAHQHPKSTPAEQGCLRADLDGEPAQGTYNHRSVIGQVGYLKGHSRPGVNFVASQCARFSNNPKRSHEKALERIGLYLKGLILNPKDIYNLPIDCYVDTDFAGLWGHKDNQNPTSVKSRTGFIIFVANCPVFWQSKLQSDVATSTMEAEYNTMSMAMRDILPLKNLLKEIMGKIGIDGNAMAKFRTILWEDNLGALQLGRLEPGRMIPRSKHYGVKYHWFRMNLKPNDIEMSPVSSQFQRSDMMTKQDTE
jgi:hypothetical protein